MRAALIFTVFLATAVVGATPSFALDRERVGYWNTDFGYLRIEEDADGEISLVLTGYDGITLFALPIVQRNEQNNIAFYWVDWLRDPALPKCETTRVGYETWGLGTLEPNGPTGFEGAWFTCDPKKGDVQFWRGELVAGSHWTSLPGTPEPAPLRPYMDMPLDRASVLMAERYPDAFPFDGMQSAALDISCDGARDQVFVWTDEDEAGAPELRIAVAYAEVRPGDEQYADRLIANRLPAAAADKVGMCIRDGTPAPFQLEVADLDDTTRADLRLPASCRSILLVAADDCRAIRYSMGFGSGGVRYPVASWADE